MTEMPPRIATRRHCIGAFASAAASKRRAAVDGFPERNALLASAEITARPPGVSLFQAESPSSAFRKSISRPPRPLIAASNISGFWLESPRMRINASSAFTLFNALTVRTNCSRTSGRLCSFRTASSIFPSAPASAGSLSRMAAAQTRRRCRSAPRGAFPGSAFPCRRASIRRPDGREGCRWT